MVSPARRLSYRILSKIESRRAFSDDALNSQAMDRLEIRDRHLTTELVYGTLRWQGLLDYVMSGVSSRPWKEVEAGVRILLRMGLYQMWMMDRIPDHALVNDAVDLAKREFGKGTDRYINGILRHLARTRPWTGKDFLRNAPPWVVHSLPEWLWERWGSRYGEKAAAEFAASLNKPPQHGLRLDPHSELPPGVIRSEVVPDAGIRGSGLPEQNSAHQYQDEASQLIPHLLRPLEGSLVWDACAAPGGKAAILKTLCGDSGIVIASDLRNERVARMKALLGEAGIRILVADASFAAPFRLQFDAVLADVPCSGLGTLRRNPEIKWQFGQENLLLLQQVQKQILNSVSKSVRFGGKLLYSTCSTEPEENEDVVRSFLESHQEFGLDNPGSLPGLEKWIGRDGMLRTFPDIRLWDGFFAALMSRHPLEHEGK